jgi:hypothetical protein
VRLAAVFSHCDVSLQLVLLLFGHLQETVDLVEDIAVQFVTETVHAAMAAAALRAIPGTTGAGSAKQKKDLDLEDLLFAVRRDPRKVARIQVGT